MPGVVYDPVRNDMFTALRDGGRDAQWRPVAVSANHQLRSSLLATQAQSDARTTFGGTARPINASGHPGDERASAR